MTLTPRLRNVISGLCALTLLACAVTVGIKWSFGYFDDGYELVADFDAAGQGLIEDSDVKMRGIDVGHVQSIDLDEGEARIVLFIDASVDVPHSTVAIIRPKTLFGEKFVDLVPGALEGSDTPDDLYADGDTIDDCTPDDLSAALQGDTTEASGCTVGAVELERVLADLYPILQAIDPADLTTILDELATGADGLGPTVHQTIDDSAVVLGVQAANNANTEQFLEDLAALTGELADRAPDLVAGAQDLNVALPVLSQNAQSFNALLSELERLSNDASELLEGNTAFIDAVYTDGQVTLDTLFAHRTQLIPLVHGLSSYVQILGSLGRIPVGDGSFMAAVKGILGGQACDPLPICTSDAIAAAIVAGSTPAAATESMSPAPPAGLLDEQLQGSPESLLGLVTRLLGGAP